MAERTNRGPGAAAENRAALLAAAREVFSEQGARAPLSAIARTAGVGQAVLYRHFPTREAIALAVFDQNMEAVEALAARPDARLREVTDLITHQIEGSAAVIAMFAVDEEAPAQRQLTRRIRLALQRVLERAIADGEVRPDATMDDLMLAVGLVTAIITTTPPGARHSRAAASWRLLMEGLAPR